MLKSTRLAVLRRNFSTNLKKFGNIEPSEAELIAVKSLPEYKKHESALNDGLNFRAAIPPLMEAMTILENINQAEDYSYAHLLDRLSLMHFLNFEMAESEKYLLRSFNMKDSLHRKAGAEKNLLKLKLANLYAYKNANLAYEYASGEIS